MSDYCHGFCFPLFCMATRSFIARTTKSGYEGVYCHWDGYLEGVGSGLLEHYMDPDKIALLLSYGDISSLGADIGGQHDFMDRKNGSETTYYGRDRGETGSHIKPRQFRKRDTLLKCAAGMGCEYVYLFEQSTGTCYYCERGPQWFGLSDGSEFSSFKPLTSELVAA